LIVLQGWVIFCMRRGSSGEVCAVPGRKVRTWDSSGNAETTSRTRRSRTSVVFHAIALTPPYALTLARKCKGCHGTEHSIARHGPPAMEVVRQEDECCGDEICSSFLGARISPCRMDQRPAAKAVSLASLNSGA
jgi:hypothetical protein